MTNPKYTIFKSSLNHEYYFNLRAPNGEIILSSEGYKTKQACQNGISSVRVHAPYDFNYQRNGSGHNFTFNLKASNSKIIGRSESYTTRHARENGIESVKQNAPTAPVQDLA